MSHSQIDTRQGNGQAVLNVPDSEVVVSGAALPYPKAQRRRFTAEYKRRILQEAEACTQPGEVGALLRREGLYSSHLTTWRRQRTRGELQGLTPAKRGRKADPQAAEIARLQRENERLKAQLERAELIIDVQKKVSQMLGLPETPSDELK
jgi:transposase